MQRTLKKFVLLLMLVCSVVCCAVFAACGDKTPTEEQKVTYTVTVTTEDDSLALTSLKAQWLSGTDVKGEQALDAEGKASVSLDKGDYTVTLDGVPTGYTFTAANVTAANPNASIVITKESTSQPVIVTYTVTVTTEEDLDLTTVTAQWKNGGTVVKSQALDAEGKASADLEEGTYVVTLDGVGSDYLFEEKTVTAENPNASIEIIAKQLPDVTVEYTVTVTAEEGFDFTAVSAQWKVGGTVWATEALSAEGTASTQLGEGDYTVTLVGVPEGYEFNDATVTAENRDATIVITKKAIDVPPDGNHPLILEVVVPAGVTLPAGVQAQLYSGTTAYGEPVDIIVGENTLTVPNGNYTIGLIGLPDYLVCTEQAEVTTTEMWATLTVTYAEVEYTVNVTAEGLDLTGVEVALLNNGSEVASAPVVDGTATVTAMAGVTYTVTLKNLNNAYEYETATVSHESRTATIVVTATQYVITIDIDAANINIADLTTVSVKLVSGATETAAAAFNAEGKATVYAAAGKYEVVIEGLDSKLSYVCASVTADVKEATVYVAEVVDGTAYKRLSGSDWLDAVTGTDFTLNKDGRFYLASVADATYGVIAPAVTLKAYESGLKTYTVRWDSSVVDFIAWNSNTPANEVGDGYALFVLNGTSVNFLFQYKNTGSYATGDTFPYLVTVECTEGPAEGSQLNPYYINSHAAMLGEHKAGEGVTEAYFVLPSYMTLDAYQYSIAYAEGLSVYFYEQGLTSGANLIANGGNFNPYKGGVTDGIRSWLRVVSTNGTPIAFTLSEYTPVGEPGTSAATAIVITAGQEVGRTTESLEAITIWYSFTPETTGSYMIYPVVIDDFSSVTVYKDYNAETGDMTQIASVTTLSWTTVSFSLTTGETYLLKFVIARANGGTATFYIDVASVPEGQQGNPYNVTNTGTTASTYEFASSSYVYFKHVITANSLNASGNFVFKYESQDSTNSQIHFYSDSKYSVLIGTMDYGVTSITLSGLKVGDTVYFRYNPPYKTSASFYINPPANQLTVGTPATFTLKGSYTLNYAVELVNVPAGKYTVTVKGSGNIYGGAELRFGSNKLTVSSWNTTGTVTIASGVTQLVIYANNWTPSGTATVTITLTRIYELTVGTPLTVTINHGSDYGWSESIALSNVPNGSYTLKVEYDHTLYSSIEFSAGGNTLSVGSFAGSTGGEGELTVAAATLTILSRGATYEGKITLTLTSNGGGTVDPEPPTPEDGLTVGVPYDVTMVGDPSWETILDIPLVDVPAGTYTFTATDISGGFYIVKVNGVSLFQFSAAKPEYEIVIPEGCDTITIYSDNLTIGQTYTFTITLKAPEPEPEGLGVGEDNAYTLTLADTNYDYVTVEVLLKDVAAGQYTLTLTGATGADIQVIINGTTYNRSALSSPVTIPAGCTSIQIKYYLVGTAELTLTLTEFIKNYTVTFDYGYEGSPASFTQETVNGKVTKPADPTREGYTFLGWYNGEVVWNFNNEVTQDMTLTAKWQYGVEYTVTFNYNFTGGVTTRSQTVNHKVTAPAVPNRAGYEFVGWFDESDVQWDFNNEVTRDMTLTAKWKELNKDPLIVNGPEITITGASTTVPVSVVLGSNVEIGKTYKLSVKLVGPSNVTVLIGYNTSRYFTFNNVLNTFATQEVTITSYGLQVMVNITASNANRFSVVLKLEGEEPAPTEYNVTFNYDDGVTENLVVKTVDGKVAKPEDPTREGYTFMGWYNGDEEWDFNADVTEDMTLTAKWEEIPVVDPETDYVVYKADDDGATSGDNHVNTEGGVLTENDLFTMTATVRTKYQDLSANSKGLTFDLTKEGYTPAMGSVTRTSYSEQEVWQITAKKDVKVLLYVQTSDSTYKSDRPEATWTIKIGENSTTVENGKNRDTINVLEIELKAGETAAVSMADTQRAVYVWLFAVEGILAEEPVPTEYNVTFDYNDDGATENLVVETVDGKVAKPEDPTREGYTFLGWFNGDEEWDFNADVTEDMTLTAKWEEIPVEPEVPTIKAGETVNVTFAYTSEDEPVVVPLEAEEGTYTLTIDNLSVAKVSKPMQIEINGVEVGMLGNLVSGFTGGSIKFKIPAGTTEIKFICNGVGKTTFTADVTLEKVEEASAEGIVFEDVNVGSAWGYFPPQEFNLNGLAAGTYTITVETTYNDNFGSTFEYHFATSTDTDTTIASVYDNGATATIVIPEGTTSLYVYSYNGSGNKITVTFTPESASTVFEDVNVGSAWGYFPPQEFNLNGLAAGTYTITVETTYNDNFGSTFEYHFATSTSTDTTIASVYDNGATATIVIPEGTTSLYVYSYNGSGNKITVTFTPAGGEEPATEYTVTFDYNDNGATENLVVETVDGKVAKPEDPTREGYTFLGWFNGDEEWDFNADVTEDMTLTAKWEEIPVVDPTLEIDVPFEVELTPATSGSYRVATVKLGDVPAGKYTLTVSDVQKVTGGYPMGLLNITVGDNSYQVGVGMLNNFTGGEVDIEIPEGCESIKLSISGSVNILMTLTLTKAGEQGPGGETGALEVGVEYKDVEVGAFWAYMGGPTAIELGKSVVAGEYTLTITNGKGNQPYYVALTSELDDFKDTQLKPTGYQAKITIPEGTTHLYLYSFTEAGNKVNLLLEKAVSEYTVTFDYNDNGATENLVVETVDGKVAKPEDPTREGYTFMGWYNGDEEWDFNADVTEDMTLTAKWEEIPVEPEVNYGTEEEPLTVAEALALAAIECVENNAVTAQVVYMKGTVTDTGTYNGTYYTNMYLADSDGTSILAYTINLKEGVTAPVVGDTLVICGYIKNYNNTIEFASNNGTYVYILSNDEAGDRTEPDPGEETVASLVFDANKTARTDYSSTQQVWEANGITFTNLKGSSTTAVGDYSNPVRIYANSTVKIEYTSAMKEIVFHSASGSSYTSDLVTSLTNAGYTATANGNDVTVVLAEATTSIQFTASKQLRFNSIDVKAAATGGEEQHVHEWSSWTHVDGEFKHTRTCLADGCTIETQTEDCLPELNICPECKYEYNETEILNALFALSAGQSLKGTYKLTGVIDSIYEISTDYKNSTFWIKVGGKDIEVFRANSANYADINVGDTVTVTGALTNYNGTFEFTSGCQIIEIIPAPAVEYTVTFVYADGETENLVVETVDGKVANPGNPTREGYTFVGWVDAAGDIWNFDADVTEDMTLTAKWEQNAPELDENTVGVIFGKLANIEELVANTEEVNTTEATELYNDGETVITAMPNVKFSANNRNFYTDDGIDEAVDYTFTHRLQTRGTGTAARSSVKIEVSGTAIISVYVRASGSSKRAFGFYDEAYAVLQQEAESENTNGHIYTYTATEAGTIYIGGASGWDIYYITVEYVISLPTLELNVPLDIELVASGSGSYVELTVALGDVPAGTYTLEVSNAQWMGGLDITVKGGSSYTLGGDGLTLYTNEKVEIVIPENCASIFLHKSSSFSSTMTLTLTEGGLGGGEDEENGGLLKVGEEYKNAPVGTYGAPSEIELDESVVPGTYKLEALTGGSAQIRVSLVLPVDDINDPTIFGAGSSITITITEETTHIYLYSFTNSGIKIDIILTKVAEEPEVPDTVIVANVEKEITIATAWSTVDYTFTAEKAGEYTITLSDMNGSDYSVRLNGNFIIEGDFGTTSATFKAEAGVENTLTFYAGYVVTFKVLISGGEAEPEVPETVIVANVEKEITIATAWSTVDYTFTAEKAGEYTITLSDMNGSDYSVRLNGDFIIEGDFGVTSATFKAEAGVENTLTFYAGYVVTFKVLISGGEEEEDGSFTMTLNAYQAEDYVFTAPEAGIYRLTLSGINAGDVTINGVIDETELTGTFKANTAGQEIVLQFYAWKACTFTATITLEQSLEGADGILHVGGSLDADIPGYYYNGDADIELGELVEGNAYSLHFYSTEINLGRNEVYVTYNGMQYMFDMYHDVITFVATSANTIKLASNVLNTAASVAGCTLTLNNALSTSGTPFDVEVGEETVLTVYMAGITVGKSYTVMTPFRAAYGRSDITLRYNGQDIKFELDDEDFVMKATFTAAKDDLKDGFIINYITIFSDTIEPNMGTLTVSMVEAEGGEGGGESSEPVVLKEFTLQVTVDGNYTVVGGPVAELSNLAAGEYTLELVDDGGMFTSWEKIVLQIGTAGKPFNKVGDTWTFTISEGQSITISGEGNPGTFNLQFKLWGDASLKSNETVFEVAVTVSGWSVARTSIDELSNLEAGSYTLELVDAGGMFSGWESLTLQIDGTSTTKQFKTTETWSFTVTEGQSIMIVAGEAGSNGTYNFTFKLTKIA